MKANRCQMDQAKSRILALSALLALAISGPAEAVDLERLVMPGPVIAGHADVESKCASCHSPLDREAEPRLCLVCHEEIAGDIENEIGFHGRAPGAGEGACRNCHGEHEGRSASIVSLDAETFDHGLTDHPLRGVHAQAGCGDCHSKDQKHREAPGECVACHRRDDPHEEFDDDCARCHGEETWQKARFDHDRTDFPLVARHQAVDCALCHPQGRYEKTPARCNDCHSADDTHRGRMGAKCGQCHDAEDWAKAKFDHDRGTQFPLRGKHRDASCNTCHRQSGVQLGTNCVDCHRPDDNHRGDYGEDCSKCHDSDGWKTIRFDHVRDAGFALEGAHSSLRCGSCHRGALHTEKLSTECRDCHRADDVHRGEMSGECNLCHQPESWARQVTFDHELSRFPLLGLHAIVPCEECHADRAFRETPSACAECHQASDVHESRLGGDCSTCHNPNGWDLWRFDHDRSTSFPLRGKHNGLACRGCHKTASNRGISLSRRCEACHAMEDPHHGSFGSRCGDCHLDGGWSDLRIER